MINSKEAWKYALDIEGEDKGMNLEKLYKMQEELDNHILGNEYDRTGKLPDKFILLDQTILALLVEIGELANATRCFKHWSTKGPMKDEVIIDELADVWHFYLSIGNQLGIRLDEELIIANEEIWECLNSGKTNSFINLYIMASEVGVLGNEDTTIRNYIEFGVLLLGLGELLGFTDEEVEQAYLKKHEENYKRQREGY